VPTYDGFHLSRFYRVDEDLYSGGQPSPAELRELVARYHIKTVIKLNPRWQGRDVVPPGVTLREHPIPAVFTPSREQILQILDEVEHAPRPLFIHCRAGADRTGLIVALYKIRHGARIEEARAEMVRHGFRPYRGVSRVWDFAVAEIRRAARLSSR
jgi:protein tyrosine/serine phosphatase